MKAVWYVSSHGLGHAARQREVLRELLLHRPGAEVTVVTGVPRWFWPRNPGISVRAWNEMLKPVDSEGSMDRQATRQALIRYCRRAPGLVEEEAAFLRETGPDLVVSDIDPVPFAACGRAGIHCLGMANFTWDWIFSRLYPEMERELDLLRRMYAEGSYLQLPFGPSEHPFARCTEVGILPGGIPRNADRAREVLGPGRACMVSLRDPARLGGELPAAPGWRYLSALPEDRFGTGGNITPEELEELGIGFADLVAASDVVLMKPGYGMISLITTQGCRAVVLQRGSFPEVPFLTEPLRGRPATILAGREEILRNLPRMLEELAEKPRPEKTEATGLTDLFGDGGMLNLK
ncbi:hypothetical protein GF402_03245 [Candidatus Fermentibacteria bacterium]|nr:hypothetical protein [Candidatus Fermentibacteria bacterium]